VDLGNMCWLWPKAPLGGVKHVAIAVERITWRFGDEAKDAVVRHASDQAGDIEIHADTCNGPLLAHLPLQSAVHATGQSRLEANLTVPAGAGVRDVCVFVTGDPRDGQWALAHMTFST
jgi:hexosaminidase